MPPTPEVSIAVLDRFYEEIDLYAAAVVIPGRAFVHDAEAKEILSADGVDRDVLRGPDMLTADAEIASSAYALITSRFILLGSSGGIWSPGSRVRHPRSSMRSNILRYPLSGMVPRSFAR